MIVHGEGAIEGGADLDPCMRIAAAAWAGEDVEETLAELDGVIVGHRAQGLEAADAIQGVQGGRWSPGGGGILGAAREAGIIAREEARQHALGVGEGTRTGQPQLRAEAILKGPKEPLDASLIWYEIVGCTLLIIGSVCWQPCYGETIRARGIWEHAGRVGRCQAMG